MNPVEVDFADWAGADETFDNAKALIATLAAEDFAGHELVAAGEDSWWCRKPGTGIMAFCVIVRPNAILIYGDVGEWILRMHGGDARSTLDWLRGATSAHYLCEKIRASHGPVKTFYPGDAYRQLAARAATEDFDAAKILNELDFTNGEEDHQKFMEMAYECTGDTEVGLVGMNLSTNSLWLVELLRTFVRLYDANVEVPL